MIISNQFDAGETSLVKWTRTGPTTAIKKEKNTKFPHMDKKG